MTSLSEKTTNGTNTVRTVRLGELAISCDDPDRSADFYMEVFGLAKIHTLDEPYAQGHVLTDGAIELSLFKFPEEYLKAHDDVPGRRYRPGFTGFHHVSFRTADVEALQRELEEQGYLPVKSIRKYLEDRKARGIKPKYVGTDRLSFELEALTPPLTGTPKDAARIRHMGIACLDPHKSMKFFSEILGMRINRPYASYGGFADGYSATDGNIQYALLRFNDEYQRAHDDVPGRGYELGFAGVHHVGFFVQDLERTHRLLAKHRIQEIVSIREFLTKHNKNQYVVEEKYVGPDRTSFEVSAADWRM